MLIALSLIFVVGLVFGLPIVFVMGISAAVATMIADAARSVIIIPQQFFTGINSTTLTAIPFFILAAELMAAGEMTPDLLRFAKTLIGHIKGGLGYSGIITSTIFAGISGSALADAAGPGAIDREMMKKDGYSPEYAAALSSAKAILGPVIPPSIMAIVYATIDPRVTVGGMFMAGVVPGLLLAFSIAVAHFFLIRRYGYTNVRPRKSVVEIIRATLRALPALMMPAIVLFGIRGGIFTPTEGAAVAAAYALVIGVFYTRTITADKLYGVMLRSALVTASTLLIVSMATLFANVLTTLQLPELLTNYIVQFTDNSTVVLIILALIVVVAGLFIDTLPALIILAPVLSPVAAKYGINPLQFGTMLVLNLAIGMVTPPVGAVLFLVSSMERIRLEKIIRHIVPMLLAEMVVLALIVAFPAISYSLPYYLGFTH